MANVLGWTVLNIFPNKMYNEILFFLLVFLGSFIIAKLFVLVARNLMSKTRTELDDIIYRKLNVPVTVLIVSFGLYAGLSFLGSIENYIIILRNMFHVWFVFLIVFIISRFITLFIDYNLRKVQERAGRRSRLDKTVAPLLDHVTTVIVYLIGFLVVMQIFNIELTPILASLGIAGLAVALALQDTLASFFASLYVVLERPINVGDYVKLESGDEGYVEKISWRNSTIRTLPGNRIVVPNSKIASMIIKNYYYPGKDCAVVLQCGVSYDSDLEKVEKVTVDVAKKTLKTVQGGNKEFDPFIRYHTFGDSNIGFSIILRVDEFVDRYLVTHEFFKNLMKAYKKNKIEISFPVRNVYFKNSRK